MKDTNRKVSENFEPSEQELTARFHQALDAPARPMTGQQIDAIIRLVEQQQIAGSFPLWALIGLVSCLMVFTLGGLAGLSTPVSAVKIAMVVVLVSNLVLAPFAALILIQIRRRKQNEN